MKLTKKRTKWVQQRTAPTIKGATLANPAAPAERYHRDLKRAVQKMRKIAEREIAKLYKTPEAKQYFAQDASVASQARILMNALSDKFDKMFGDLAPKASKRMVSQVDKASKSATAQSMKVLSGGMTIKTNVMGADLRETIKASIAANVDLIKSIPQEYMKRVSGAVFRSVTSGQGMADLLPQVKKYGDMTDRRAKNLALDQTRKAYNSINADRMQKVGVKKFEWIHSGGGLHPRRDHQEMDGKIYSFDNLPVIDQNTGERGIPGQAPNCKCTMRPVVDFEDDAQ